MQRNNYPPTTTNNNNNRQQPPERPSSGSTAAVITFEQAKQTRKVITEEMHKKREHLAQVLPDWLTPEQVLNMLLQGTLRNPELLECAPVSFLNAAFRAAEMGLQPDGNQGYLIPWWNEHLQAKEVQFQPSYMGMLELAFRAGLMTKAQARIIYQHEKHQILYGTEDRIEHTPILDGKQRGAMIAVYAFVRFQNGEHKFEVLTVDEVDRIKARSKTKNGGPWVTDYEEMSKKVAFRRLLKTVRKSRAELGVSHSPELANLDKALEVDAEDYEWEGGPKENLTPVQAKTAGKHADLRNRLQQRKAHRPLDLTPAY